MRADPGTDDDRAHLMAIHAVTGAIEHVDGAILPHEHLFCDFTSLTGDLDHLLNDTNVAIRELRFFEQVGGAVIVDVTPADLGRLPSSLLAVARATSVSIVMGTGWYRRAFYPDFIDTKTSRELADDMIGELLDGVRTDSGELVYAGVIGEIGVDRDQVSALEERVLRASAMASSATGAPITTHASMYPVGLKQLKIFAEYDLDPESIIIGHADTFLDRDYHQRIVDAGCFIQFDTIGRHHMNSDADRIDNILHLIDSGYERQILLSTDRCFRSDLKTFGGLGYDYLFTDFRQSLMERGVSSATFDLMTRINPMRALSWLS